MGVFGLRHNPDLSVPLKSNPFLLACRLFVLEPPPPAERVWETGPRPAGGPEWGERTGNNRLFCRSEARQGCPTGGRETHYGGASAPPGLRPAARPAGAWDGAEGSTHWPHLSSVCGHTVGSCSIGRHRVAQVCARPAPAKLVGQKVARLIMFSSDTAAGSGE
jgi:hypothetical protein